MDLVTGVLVESLPGFGGKEEILAVARHPGTDTQFGVPIAGRSVDMIDTVGEQDVQHAIRLGLGRAAECRRTKERDCAQVSSASKRSFLNHEVLLACARCVRGSPRGHAISHALHRKEALWSVGVTMVVTLAYPLSPVLTVLSHQVWWPMITIQVVMMDTSSVAMWYFATVGY